jgi:hypothetical protein
MVISNTRESAADYAFAFQEIVNAVRLFHRIDYHPDYIVADGTLAVDNAIQQVWPEETPLRIMCWKHMVEAVCKKMRKPFNIPVKRVEDFRADLEFIQALPTVELFQNGLRLFIEKQHSKSSS